MKMEPVPSTVVKRYPARGPLQQIRFVEATAFRCFRCGATKKSKLIVIYSGDWSRKLCNGCYRRLHSLFKIKAWLYPEDQRAEALAEALIGTVVINDILNAERLLRLSEKRADFLTPESVRFVATAEHVAGMLQSEAHLEWSPPIIGLCKAVEAEIVFRILRPLSIRSSGEKLTIDISDKDIGRVASFCANNTRKPPEIGAFAHFLQTTIHSQLRRKSSPLIRCFLTLLKEWTGSQWLLDPNGLHRALVSLTTEFRNRAAHIDELSKRDYDSCRNHVIGADGMLWRLLTATEIHK